MDVRAEEVRERAYRIWEDEGKPHGRDLEHWLQAERELSATNDGLLASPKRKRVTGTTSKGRTASSRPRTRRVTS